MFPSIVHISNAGAMLFLYKLHRKLIWLEILDRRWRKIWAANNGWGVLLTLETVSRTHLPICAVDRRFSIHKVKNYCSVRECFIRCAFWEIDFQIVHANFCKRTSSCFPYVIVLNPGAHCYIWMLHYFSSTFLAFINLRIMVYCCCCCGQIRPRA